MGFWVLFGGNDSCHKHPQCDWRGEYYSTIVFNTK